MNLDNQIGRNRRLSLKSGEDLEIDEQQLHDEVTWGDAIDDEDLVVNDADDSHKLTQLMRESSSAQELLQIAASLSSLDTRLLEASTSSQINTSEFLSQEMNKGIVVYDSKENGYVFASDTLKNALYNNIPRKERSRQHLQIGRNLIKNLSQEELEERYYFAVLRQFHLGVDAIKKQEERYSIAAQCLNAANLSVSKGDFDTCLLYLYFGLDLLLLSSKNCWREEYDLSLAIYNASAEIEYSKCNFERVDELVSVILEHAYCFQDTLRARAAQIYTLSSRYEMTKAVETSLDVLEKLGEPLPANPSKLQVLWQFLQTKRLLRSKTNEMILRMSHMTDANKIATSQILNLMFPSTFRTKPLLFALVVLKLVQLTCKYGLNAVSAVGFAYYGSLLCAFSSRDIDRGYAYGQLSLALLEKFSTREWIPRVYLGVYGHTGSYKLPLQEMVPRLKEARMIALETGDIEYASNSSNIICAYIHLSGESLAVLEETCLECFQCGKFEKQETSALYMQTCLQLVHNLTGRNHDPLKLSGEILKDDADTLSKVTAHHDEVGVGFTHFLSLQLAYIFNNYEEAAAKAPEVVQIIRPPYLHPSMSCPYTFHSLALLAVCKNRRGRARRSILSTARRAIKTLKIFSSHTPETCLGKMYLLEAEVAAISGSVNVARCKYASAAGASGEFGDKMMHAIACERGGLFFRDIGDELSATRYFQKAHAAFVDWGATSKVEQLEKQIPGLAVSR